MVLNKDCVRDVLLVVEQHSIHDYYGLNELCKELPQYTEDDLWYTCLKLKEANYLDVITTSVMRRPRPVIQRIKDITFEGHEFLDTVRPETSWQKIKSISEKTGASSVRALMDIGKVVAAEIIKSAVQSGQPMFPL